MKSLSSIREAQDSTSRGYENKKMTQLSSKLEQLQKGADAIVNSLDKSGRTSAAKMVDEVSNLIHKVKMKTKKAVLDSGRGRA